MSCKALLFTANTVAQTVAVNGIIALGNVIRRRVKNCDNAPSANLVGSADVLQNGDYYEIDANVVVTPTAAGTVVVTMLQDGVAVSSASATVAAAATTVTIPLIGIVRTRGGSSNITFQLTGAASTVNAIYTTVEQL